MNWENSEWLWESSESENYREKISAPILINQKYEIISDQLIFN